VTSADADRIRDLLADETLSFRAVAREVGCSDWTVRRIAREFDGDPRPMKRGSRVPQSEGSEIGAWVRLALFVGLLALGLWFSCRGTPPET
jgi:hypothetical protein